MTLLCAVFIVLVFISVGRGIRVKSWRLYILTALVMFAWLALSLYKDHIDQHYVQEFLRNSQKRTVYDCVRNLVHGLTLYLIILVLSHMSDFQHHGSWLGLVFTVILVPLVYSISVLVVDMRLHVEDREHHIARTAILGVRTFLYNLVTTILILVFSAR